MQKCPKCGVGEVHRSRSRNKLEVWWKRISGHAYFRCRACGWRGRGKDVGPTFTPEDLERAHRAVAAEPVNLSESALDSALPAVDTPGTTTPRQ